jgi:hypothetical protein
MGDQAESVQDRNDGPVLAESAMERIRKAVDLVIADGYGRVIIEIKKGKILMITKEFSEKVNE